MSKLYKEHRVGREKARASLGRYGKFQDFVDRVIYACYTEEPTAWREYFLFNCVKFENNSKKGGGRIEIGGTASQLLTKEE